MDNSFTEHILERARERQRKLNDLNASTPLNESSILLNKKQNPLSATPIKQDCKAIPTPESGLSSTFYDSSSKENCSEGRVQKIIRHNSTTKISSDMPGSPQPQLKTLNIQKDNFNMEIKLISSDNVRVEVEIQESDNSDDENSTNGTKNKNVMQTPGLREEAKYRLKKLGKLYAGGEDADISSPIQRTEAKFLSQDLTTPDHDTSPNECEIVKKDQRKGLSKLADLAQNMSQWEDHVSNPNNSVHHKKSCKAPAPQPPTNKLSGVVKSNLRLKPRAPEPPIVQEISCKPEIVSSTKKLSDTSSKVKTNEGLKDFTKQLQWDKSVLASLESQGFSRTTSNSRLVYKYNNSQETKLSESQIENIDENEEKSNLTMTGSLESNDASKESEQECRRITMKKLNPLNLPIEEQKLTPRSPTKLRSVAIANKASIFESSPKTAKDSRDPALMSLAERKALFEKKKGTALVPKAAFGMAAPVTQKSNKKFNVINDEKKAKVVQKNCDNDKKLNMLQNTQYIKPTLSSDKSDLTETKPFVSSVDSPTKVAISESGGIASKIAALAKAKNTISQEQIEKDIKQQRQKEMDVVLNRFNRSKEISNKMPVEESDEEDVTETTSMIVEKSTKVSTPSPAEQDKRSAEKRAKKGDSPQVTAVLEDVKRVKINEPKYGHLYPCLSDIETATETETEHTNTSPNSSYQESFCSSEGGANTSFGREILQVVCKNQTPQKRSILDDSTSTDVSDILDDMDDYLDEAMAADNSNSTNGPTPPKLKKVLSPIKTVTKPSDSFHYKSYSSDIKEQISPNIKSPIRTITSPRKSSDLPTHVVDGESVLPLTHTVSFYRRQQTQVKTPVRQVNRQPVIEESEDSQEDDESEVVSNKIQELLNEVNKQQMVISQTSQALNLCNSTPEFMGSTEQVEAEKVLLLATHRRQAALHEVQRLKVEKTLRPQSQHAQNVPLEKGTLTITNINLPLKREYVRALAAAGGKGHHVVCLIKSGEKVVSTQLVSTVANTNKNPDLDLIIPGIINLDNIYSDFTVTFEVYCLQAQEEVLPHEVKYHINKKASNKLTPKKSKQDSRMLRPPKESPAGPQAVRSPTFALMGFVVFSIQTMNKTHWTLNKAPSMSPLVGSVDMKISCELAVSVEHRGFLTMFKDVSGLGAWHRRWCVLKGYTLSYWKYPDDEKKNTPMGTIDLKNSITDYVGPVSRDICSRLHTFLIEDERDSYSDDKESLTTVCKGNKTVIRHILSADTKEERIEWCKEFNKALTALKMWGNN